MGAPRFLCLHGAGCNESILRSQLAPLSRAFASQGGIVFHCVNAPNHVVEAPGVAEFHSGPYLGWLDLPCTISASDTDIPQDTIEDAIAFIDDIVADEGPFSGILGFSQGATVAFCYLLHQLKIRPFDPPFVPFPCAVFLSASGTERDRKQLLEYIKGTGRSITIPTLHIRGEIDEDGSAAMAMFEHCKAEGAELVMHPYGHIIPSDEESLQRIVKAIKELEGKSALGVF